MIWWVNQPKRAMSEKADVAALAHRVPWLKVVKWDLSDFPILKADIEIEQGERTIPLTLVYPNLFPGFPAHIVPKEGVRLSSHQYGPKGELCLEWRADNWLPEVTGAMLIESAYRLLSTESDAEEVESAHDITIGQEVRANSVRLMVPANCKEQMFQRPEGSITPIRTMERYYVKTWVSEVIRIGAEDSPVWEVDPMAKYSNTPHDGFLVRQAPPANFETRPAVEAFFGDAYRQWVADHPGKSFVMIFAHAEKVSMYELLENPDKEHLVEYRTIYLPEGEIRSPSEHANLAQKRVGIVGCGSVGSKIAASLARSGVSHFVLVDSDFLSPGNIVRNELDTRALGTNKTKALERKILEINGRATVEIYEIMLGRQESGAWSAATAAKLSECDLIVDATADTGAFLTCAAVAQAYTKPMVWGRVYEGGLGGLIARSRPQLDPVPQAARRQIDGWFQKKGVPWKSSAESRNYEGVADGEPLVATDAEVGLVAMHMTRFVLDALAKPDASVFPSSAYAIGFCERWIFEQPFDVWPIELATEGTWGAPTEDNKDENLKDLIAELVDNPENSDAS